jgi:uncharacterized DUF497 family protein
MEFEWDLSKEIENLQKHGIAFAEAVETFLRSERVSVDGRQTLGDEGKILLSGQVSI